MADILGGIYNAFDPFRPLEPGDPFYVVCHEVRGNDNIINELGRKIERSNQPTCQLYTGHQGVGKSTELKRLKADLESKGYVVIYFVVDEDIEEEDTQYTDILLACTRHILEELKDRANPSPLINWLKARWESLKGLASTEVKFEDLKLEAQILQFAKLTASLRQVPNTRETIRQQVDIHSISLTEALNEFVGEAQRQLGTAKLIVIVDNLDRIVPVPRRDGRNNHDEIFIDRSGQLRRLQCHVIYTVPISLVYSDRASALQDRYGNCQVLPMLMVQQRNEQVYTPGLIKVKELISRRVNRIAPNLNLDTDVFDSIATVERLCLTSGGRMRDAMQLMQTAIDWTDALPISARAVQKLITRMQRSYQDAVNEADWKKLAEVSRSKRIPNDDEYRTLLFNRCLLEYRDDDEIRWHDVHPLLKGVAEFQTALSQLPKL